MVWLKGIGTDRASRQPSSNNFNPSSRGELPICCLYAAASVHTANAAVPSATPSVSQRLSCKRFSGLRRYIQQQPTPPERNSRPLYRNADRFSALLRPSICFDETFVSASTERRAMSPQAKLPSCPHPTRPALCCTAAARPSLRWIFEKGLLGSLRYAAMRIIA